jgi:sugar phosphate isomerase/epimerase
VRRLSLAAGCLLDAGASATLRAAAGAGFDTAGLRLPPRGAPTRAADLRVLADDLGLGILDLEVVRLGPETAFDDHLRLLESAQVLGADHLLTVSMHADRAATEDELGRLCAAAAGGPTRVALEFMRFTAVHTLADALALAGDAVVLVDALHLARTGGTPADLAAVAPRRIGYLQICDAPADAPAADLLAEEARHHRLPPGAGELPLAALLAAAPELPVSVEVQSDRLAADHPPAERARRLRAAAVRTLEEAACAPR